GADAVSDDSVTVQVTGTHNLSPRQQLIGLESQRAERNEALQLLEIGLLRLRTIEQFASDMEPLVISGPTARDAFGRTLLMLRSQQQGDGEATPLAVQAAHREIAQDLVSIRSRIVEMPLDPPEPLLEPWGFSRSYVILAGLVLGLIGSLIFWRDLL